MDCKKILINNSVTFRYNNMNDSLLMVEKRIKEAVSSYNSIMLIKEDGPLIEPSRCEIVNECHLSIEMVSTYEQHITHMKNSFLKTASFIKIYLNSIGIFGDIFEISITILACIEYVSATYLENDYKDIYTNLDVTIASVFLVDWAVHVIMADKRIEYLLSYGSLIDYLTIIPVYLEYFGNSFGIKMNYFRVLRVFRSLRILRLFKTLEAISEEDDDNNKLKYTVDTSGVSKQILITSLTLLSVLFISAGIVNSINEMFPGAYYYPAGSTFDFLAAFYYMIVTSSTLGYGDIFPTTTISRMFTVILVFFIIFIITNQLSKITQLMGNYSKYDTQYNFKEHIIIVGNYKARTLSQFLAQFYHSDHGEVSTNSIIINLEYPTSEIIGILTDPRYEGKVAYLEGNPSHATTWRNANVELAESVFILTEQLEDNLKSQDTFAILLARMIQGQCPLIRTYVQLIRPIECNMSTENSTWNTVVSLQTIKMSLLGTSIHNPGFSTLMGGLYLTFSSSSSLDYSLEWISQFVYGLSQEIYCVRISDYFIGMNFSQAVEIIYKNCEGILTLGVKSLIGISSKYEIMINPINYKIQKDDLVFVITGDQSTADLITEYSDNINHKSVSASSYAQIALSHNFKTIKLAAKNYSCDIPQNSIIDLVQEDVNNKISKHILVFGSLEGFELLIKAIRVYSNQPICLVNESDPGIQWEKFARFENIFYFKGKTMNFQDLYNTGIKDCFSALILPNRMNSGIAPDSEVILLTKLIEYSFPHVRITVELADKSFVRFMGSRPVGKYKKYSYNLWPNAVSGKVFFSSNLDSFICQTYYNPDLLDVILRVMGITVNEKNNQTIEQNSIIRTIKIPKFYFTERSAPLLYGEIFSDLLHLNPPVIPLGILSKTYTATDDDPEIVLKTMQKLDQPIVLTNPRSNTPIGKSDKIICIGEPKGEVSSPGDSERKNQEVGPEEICRLGFADILIKNKNSNLSNMHDETKEDDENEALECLFNILKKRMETPSKLQKNIEYKNRMIQELQKEADSLKEQLIRKNSD